MPMASNGTQPSEVQTMSETPANDDEVQHDGYNVVDEVSPDRWVDYHTEGFSEYVHLVIDKQNRELRCYRTVNDDFPSKRVKTTIENVRFKLHYDNDSSDKTVRGFYLTWRQADTFVTFVDLMARCREGGNPDAEVFTEKTPVVLDWYENNEKPSHEESRVNDETIDLSFTNCRHDERHVEIMDTWVAPSNQMAKYEELD